VPPNSTEPNPVVTIEKLVAGGYGLFRNPQVGLVPFAMPGDSGTVTQPRKLRNPVVQLQQLLAPSQARIQPQCGVFTLCGGCQWQHVPLPLQLFWKQNLIAEAFGRLGRLPAPYPIAPVMQTQAFETRRKIRLQCAQKLTPQGGLQLQLVGTDPNQRVTPNPCALISGVLQRVIDALPMVAWKGHTPEQVTLWLADDDGIHVIMHAGDKPVKAWLQTVCDRLPGVVGIHWLTAGHVLKCCWGQRYMTHTVEGMAYRVSPGSFFQVNRLGAQALCQQVQQWLGSTPLGHVVDAYAGVGLLSAAVAGQCQHLTLIESHPNAVADAKWNLKDHANVTVIEQPVDQGLTQLDNPVDVVIADPPRSGLGPVVCDWLGQHVRQKIILMSCDVTTLARDLSVLLPMGWKLVACQPVDMFPQTWHVEVACLLERT
jgi:23S rRNA (uracil1939-C5)-methyltransferase